MDADRDVVFEGVKGFVKFESETACKHLLKEIPALLVISPRVQWRQIGLWKCKSKTKR